MAEQDRKLYAVLIDADNVDAKYAGAILKEVTRFAEPAMRKVYGDWTSSRLARWKGEVREHGLVAHQETANTTGKNASDIGMVIDAMDVLHGGRMNGFVIVSSDSDFTRLASRIREHGLDVIGMGAKHSHKSFVSACQRFIYLENILGDSEPDASEDAPASKQSAKKASTAKKSTSVSPAKAVPLILRAMDKIDQEGEWFSLGRLGQHIQLDNPDFDARTYGKKKLSDLVVATRRFEIEDRDGTPMVRRMD